MIVLTADQVDSRHHPDLADGALELIAELAGDRLVRPADRTAGDEIQLATEHADLAVELLLELTRRDDWSVGVGVGEVRLPLPDSTRAMTGSAFVQAREAVEAAKRRPTRFAIRVDEDRAPTAAELEPLVDLLLQLRARRTPEGWELFELLRTGLTQRDAAARLGITPQAASLRAQTAQLRTEFAARDALATLLARADDNGSGKEPS